MIYSLNVPQNYQNLSLFWFLSSLATSRRMVTFFNIFWHNFDISLRVILPLSWEMNLWLVVMANTRYIVYFSFSGSQSKPSWVSKVYQLLWESHKRSTCLGTVTHGWTLTVCHWANRKRFLSSLCNIWNSSVVFYNKPHVCWGADVSIDMYQLLFLFSIILHDFLLNLKNLIFVPIWVLFTKKPQKKTFFKKCHFLNYLIP